jgi:hypothetical protein
VLLGPSGRRRTELIERIVHRFQDALQAVQGADRRQDVGRIGPLGAPSFEPAPRFAGGQKRVEQALSRRMGEQPPPKIVQQGEVKSRVGQLEAQGLLPVHTAADRIRRLAIGEPFEILHHHDQRQAPGRDFHGTPGRGIQIGEELITVERAELSTELHREVAFGKSGLHGGHCRLWNRW